MKGMNKRILHLIEQNQAEEKFSQTVNTVEIHLSKKDAW